MYFPGRSLTDGAFSHNNTRSYQPSQISHGNSDSYIASSVSSRSTTPSTSTVASSLHDPSRSPSIASRSSSHSSRPFRVTSSLYGRDSSPVERLANATVIQRLNDARPQEVTITSRKKIGAPKLRPNLMKELPPLPKNQRDPMIRDSMFNPGHEHRLPEYAGSVVRMSGEGRFEADGKSARLLVHRLDPHEERKHGEHGSSSSSSLRSMKSCK